jgi:predicted acylesterase/phospholipase RssA
MNAIQFFANISKHIPFLSKPETLSTQDTVGSILRETSDGSEMEPGVTSESTTAYHISSDTVSDTNSSVDAVSYFEKKPCPTTIRHIVIAGGGDYGLSFYRALRDSHHAGFWNIQNIETIYATSIGSLFTVWISLLSKLSFDIYDDFVLNRPWDKVFDFHIHKLLQLIKEKGIFGKKVVENIIAPVFHSLDIPLDITVKDFYEFTNIEMHLIATNLTTFEMVDISYKTHPEWTVLDALYSSMGLPVLFSPHIIEGKIYADGAFTNNYPVNLCIQNGANPDEILGLVRKSPMENKEEVVLNTLIDYIFFIMGTLLARVATPPMKIKNQIEFLVNDAFVNIYSVYQCTSRKERRAELFQIGTSTWNAFYEKTYPTLMETVQTETDQIEPLIQTPTNKVLQSFANFLPPPSSENS